ncbi:MAG: hypothetical protein H7833_20385 [Magnetococcus sp. DMHC-1]|nr:hypothetical protein [Magnetococcales bacterium]
MKFQAKSLENLFAAAGLAEGGDQDFALEYLTHAATSSPEQQRQREISLALFMGMIVVGMYSLLFFREQDVLHYTTLGGYYALVPILIAFLFSMAHGFFTAAFWNVLGIKAKK